MMEDLPGELLSIQTPVPHHGGVSKRLVRSFKPTLRNLQEFLKPNSPVSALNQDMLSRTGVK